MTPRRNDDIESAMKFMRDLQRFFDSVHANIKKTVQIETMNAKDTMKDVFDAVPKNSKKDLCLSVPFWNASMIVTWVV